MRCFFGANLLCGKPLSYSIIGVDSSFSISPFRYKLVLKSIACYCGILTLNIKVQCHQRDSTSSAVSLILHVIDTIIVMCLKSQFLIERKHKYPGERARERASKSFFLIFLVTAKSIYNYRLLIQWA